MSGLHQPFGSSERTKGPEIDLVPLVQNYLGPAGSKIGGYHYSRHYLYQSGTIASQLPLQEPALLSVTM